MQIEADSDVLAVMEFMQSNIPATKLVAVAISAAAIAPILWGHYGDEPIQAMRLLSSSARDLHTQLETNGSHLVP